MSFTNFHYIMLRKSQCHTVDSHHKASGTAIQSTQQDTINNLKPNTPFENHMHFTIYIKFEPETVRKSWPLGIHEIGPSWSQGPVGPILLAIHQHTVVLVLSSIQLPALMP